MYSISFSYVFYKFFFCLLVAAGGGVRRRRAEVVCGGVCGGVRWWCAVVCGGWRWRLAFWCAVVAVAVVCGGGVSGGGGCGETPAGFRNEWLRDAKRRLMDPKTK